MSSKRGLGDRPRRNLEVYRDQVAEWLQQGLKRSEIVRQLQDELGADIGPSTLGRRLEEWGLYYPDPGKGWVYNLDKHKVQLLEWEDQGVTVEDMAARIRPDYRARLSTVTIQKALKRWRQPDTLTWRSLNVRPSEDLILENPGPADLLSNAELKLLSQGIQEAYLTRPGEVETTHYDLESHWTEILAHAACHDEAIPASLIREKLQPGYHWDNNRQFNPLWILGIQLPGSYREKPVNTQDKISQLVKSITPTVLERVRSIVLSMIEESISLAVREEGEDYIKTALEVIPATSPPDCVVKLMQLTRREIGERQLNYELRRSLGRLQVSDSPACASLLEHLKRDCEAPSLLERFTSVVLDGLQAWQQPCKALQDLAPLGPFEMDLVEGDDALEPLGTTTSAAAKRKLQSICDESNPLPAGNLVLEVDSADEDDHEVEIEDTERLQNLSQDAQYARLYKLLSDRIKKKVPQPSVFSDWRSPTSGALLGCSLVRFGSPAWDYCVSGHLKAVVSEGGTQDGIEGIMNSFGDSRRLSEADFLSPTQLDQEAIFRDAANHLNMIITSQTSKERDDYRRIYERMCSCLARPAGISSLQLRDLGWGPIIRDDNWWHCRRLLQMIAVRYCIPLHEYHAYELRITMTLAAVEGGSSEPLPWLIALDGILLALSRQLHSFETTTSSEASLRDRLIMELSTFVHGTALNNIVLRFPAIRRRNDPGNAPWTIQKWYTMICQLEPHCANPGCLRFLPSPRALISHTISRAFSVGNRDCRVGCRRARSFVSQNRWQIYPCLMSWIREREPHPALVCAFAWYAGIFHTDSSCKAGIGK